MSEVCFTDKYGREVYLEADKAKSREEEYIIISKPEYVACIYETEDNLYSFPNRKDIGLKEEPSFEFSVFSYLLDKDKQIKELQSYSVYLVEDGDFSETVLKWISIEDILLGKTKLNATQMVGFKNFLVRGRNNV